MIESLLNLSSSVVSRYYSFAIIEQIHKNIIPEPVQKSIIYHSFPKHESDVLVYASNEFNFNHHVVSNVIQIGFHISAIVNSKTHNKIKKFEVSCNFDRGKITFVDCNCQLNNVLFWCDHVVAMAIHRIRFNQVGKDFTIRVPISETLLQLNRSQLQKLVQYLISDHTDVLPTAQRIADDIIFKKTDNNFINNTHGAPDPTAGPSAKSATAWSLNLDNVESQIRTLVNSAQSVQEIIDRIYSLLKLNHSNGQVVLKTLTNELVVHATESTTSRYRSHSIIWDQIVNLWVVVGVSTQDHPESTYISTLANNPVLPETTLLHDSPTQKSIFHLPDLYVTSKMRLPDMTTARTYSRMIFGLPHNWTELYEFIKESRQIRIENGIICFDALLQSHERQAYEIALISLTSDYQVRQIPYACSSLTNNIEYLIKKIEKMNYNDLLASSIQTCTKQPCYYVQFANYAFNKLQTSEAYAFALKHLAITIESSVFENLQTHVSVNLLTSLKHDKGKISEISTAIESVVKSQNSVFKIASQVYKIAQLSHVALDLGISVLKHTKESAHRKRWEFVRWVVSCTLDTSVSRTIDLINSWQSIFNPIEAVSTLANNVLTCVNKFDVKNQAHLSSLANNLAIQCAKADPQNCALNALTLCESNGKCFESTYEYVLESSKKELLTPQQIFTIARYLEHRGYTDKAYKLAVIALQYIHVNYNQETHVLVSEIHWTCGLSHQLSAGKESEFEILIPLLIRNIKSSSMLTEILRRSITMMSSFENGYVKSKKPFRLYDKLSLLVEGTIDSYITTTHSRLIHISPRHYSDFIEFLTKARDNFLLAPNGNARFKHLVHSMKNTYKGKKKLLFLLTQRFG